MPILLVKDINYDVFWEINRYLKQTYWYLQNSNWFWVDIIVKSESNFSPEGGVIWWETVASSGDEWWWRVLDEVESEPRSWQALVVILYHKLIHVKQEEVNIKTNLYTSNQHSPMYLLPNSHPKLLVQFWSSLYST